MGDFIIWSVDFAARENARCCFTAEWFLISGEKDEGQGQIRQILHFSSEGWQEISTRLKRARPVYIQYTKHTRTTNGGKVVSLRSEAVLFMLQLDYKIMLSQLIIVVLKPGSTEVILQEEANITALVSSILYRFVFVWYKYMYCSCLSNQVLFLRWGNGSLLLKIKHY